MMNYYLMTATAQAMHQDRLEEAARDRLLQSLPVNHAKPWLAQIVRLYNRLTSIDQKRVVQVEVNHPALS